MVEYNLPVEYNRLSPSEKKAVRIQYMREQNGECYHCGTPLSSEPSKEVLDAWIDWRLFPKNFQKYPIHLHHDHDTGLTLGAVHNRCNAYLWQYLGE